MKLITKDRVAFSQPTEVGAKLARKWTGKKYGWLVYSA
jgi:N-acetyltransferase